MRVPLFAMLLAAAGTVSAQARPPQHELVRGRVTSDSARAIPGATIVVTRLSDRESKVADTDAGGRYSIDWPDGTGDYVVNASAQGYGPLSSHVTRTGADSVIVADFTLRRPGAAQALSAVVVSAQRTQRDREARGQDPGSNEFSQFTPNANRRLDPDLAGDLASIAALGTGIMPVNGGISVLGLGAAQNSTTLNGMAFGATDVPRDAATRVRVTSSSYDPSIGWFSGARTQVDLVPGDLFTNRSGHLTFDAPAVQWTDPISAKLGQRFANFNAGIGGTGQLVNDLWSYNYGLQGGHKTSDYANLQDADPDLLQHTGIAADSAARLTQLLRSAGIPYGSSGFPIGRVDDNVSFIGRIDHAPYDWKTLESAKTTWGVTGYGKWARTQGLGLGPSGTLASAGESSMLISSLAGEWSTYFAADHLADVRSSVSYTRTENSPYLNLPGGQVLVASTFPDGTGGVSNLQFGGSPTLRTTNTRFTWESIGDVQLFSPGPVTHKPRVTADVRYDAGSRVDGTNALGTYYFNSLGDLAANQPSLFTRSLASPTQNGAAWNAFAAVGDVWRATPNVLINYGARAEGNVFTGAPAYNPAIDQLFGVRTDHAPDAVDVSPRLGFLYNVPSSRGKPLGSVRGGVGEFRNLLDPTLLAAPSVSTGLPNGATQVACFGSAVPVPDWNAMNANSAAIPTQCAGGAGSSLAYTSPAVRVMAPDFTASKSWRANLGWSGTWLRMPYSIDATVSRNLDQRGLRDLNFSGVQRFVTSDEGRPVYASAQNIVTPTGAVSPADSRISSAYGSVNEGVSDLRSESRQLSLTIRPYLGTLTPRYLGDFIIGYTLASVRDQERGFDFATFGDPTQLDWARGALDARHQFVVQGVVHVATGINLYVSGHVESGLPYTPMVRTDVNGDGLSNDRAFVFDPAHTTDPALASGMRALLASTSPTARDCLMRQLGAAAARASCEGPWSASLNTSLAIFGEQVFNLPRVNVTIGLANALGGLDQLIHGPNNLHGWGTSPAPDPVLLDVHGFDAARNRFIYAVNPRFGSTSAANNTIRAPFRLTLDVQVDLAPPQTQQQMERWLGGGSGAVSADALAKRFQRTVPDPYSELLQQADSLLLTRQQIANLQQADDRYRAHIDSIWTSLSGYLASLPDAKSVAAAYKKTDQSTDDAWEITRTTIQRDFREILTPDQLTMLPGTPRFLFNAQARVHIRMYPRGG